MFKRIISALRVNRIIPGGPWNEAGIQMITQAKCPIIKLKTLQGTLSASGKPSMNKPLHRNFAVARKHLGRYLRL